MWGKRRKKEKIALEGVSPALSLAEDHDMGSPRTKSPSPASSLPPRLPSTTHIVTSSSNFDSPDFHSSSISSKTPVSHPPPSFRRRSLTSKISKSFSR